MSHSHEICVEDCPLVLIFYSRIDNNAGDPPGNCQSDTLIQTNNLATLSVCEILW